MSMKDRIMSEAQAIQPIQIKDLVCKDCFHRSPRTDVCAVYQNIKPKTVFDGGDCNYYQKEEQNE